MDYYWDRFSAEGQAVACGWLKDRYGLSWPVLVEMMSDADPERARRVTEAMLTMTKLVIATLAKASVGGVAPRLTPAGVRRKAMGRGTLKVRVPDEHRSKA